MTISERLQTEVSHYLILGDQLKEFYGEIDEETFRDTLEGISDLPELIEAVVRASLEDDALICGLKDRLADMQARLDRLKDRYERKRDLAKWAMESAGLDRIQASDFTASLRQGQPKLEVVDEAKVPPTYFVPQPPRLDRTELGNALKRGEQVEGARLSPGQLNITVRVK